VLLTCQRPDHLAYPLVGLFVYLYVTINSWGVAVPVNQGESEVYSYALGTFNGETKETGHHRLTGSQ
jgi:hypothetical protein